MADSSKSEPVVTLARIISYAQSVARQEAGTTKLDPPERAALYAARDALFSGAKKAPGSKKRRRVEETPTNRPCSPMLFPTSSSTSSASVVAPPSYKRVLLNERLEGILNTAVTPLYERPSSAGAVVEDEKLVPAHRYTSLGYLLLPIRRPSVLEKWTAHDIAVFEAAICLHGKKFDVIRTLLPSKTTKEIIEFYYVWKTTSHKPFWKKSFKAVE